MEKTSHKTSAFRPPARNRRLIRLTPPVVHVVPYATSGLSQLYKQIHDGKTQTLHDSGVYTSEDGRFCPNDDMPLLACRYRYLTVIGKGQSSTLLKAQDTFNCDLLVSIKVLNTQYNLLGAQEVDCIRRLNQADPYSYSSTLRLYNTFTFDGHYCMVFPLLDPKPLTEFFRTVPTGADTIQLIKRVALKLLQALGFLQQQNVIHADLKPENILLKSANDLSSVCVVDFGNAIHCVHDELSLYYDDFELQTPLYRAPEVIYGIPFGVEVDMWSLGCILAELFLKTPIFVGSKKISMLKSMGHILGPLPHDVFKKGKFFGELRNFTANDLQPDATLNLIRRLRYRDYTFANFLAGLLRYNPDERMTVTQAAQHPFLASEIGVQYLLPASVQGHTCGYSGVLPSKESYRSHPHMDNSRDRQHMSSTDLLHYGTGSSLELPYYKLYSGKIPFGSVRTRTLNHEQTPDRVQPPNRHKKVRQVQHLHRKEFLHDDSCSNGPHLNLSRKIIMPNPGDNSNQYRLSDIQTFMQPSDSHGMSFMKQNSISESNLQPNPLTALHCNSKSQNAFSFDLSTKEANTVLQTAKNKNPISSQKEMKHHHLHLQRCRDFLQSTLRKINEQMDYTEEEHDKTLQKPLQSAVRNTSVVKEETVHGDKVMVAMKPDLTSEDTVLPVASSNSSKSHSKTVLQNKDNTASVGDELKKNKKMRPGYDEYEMVELPSSKNGHAVKYDAKHCSPVSISSSKKYSSAALERVDEPTDKYSTNWKGCGSNVSESTKQNVQLPVSKSKSINRSYSDNNSPRSTENFTPLLERKTNGDNSEYTVKVSSNREKTPGFNFKEEVGVHDGDTIAYRCSDGGQDSKQCNRLMQAKRQHSDSDPEESSNKRRKHFLNNVLSYMEKRYLDATIAATPKLVESFVNKIEKEMPPENGVPVDDIKCESNDSYYYVPVSDESVENFNSFSPPDSVKLPFCSLGEEKIDDARQEDRIRSTLSDSDKKSSEPACKRTSKYLPSISQTEFNSNDSFEMVSLLTFDGIQKESNRSTDHVQRNLPKKSVLLNGRTESAKDSAPKKQARRQKSQNKSVVDNRSSDAELISPKVNRRKKDRIGTEKISSLSKEFSEDGPKVDCLASGPCVNFENVATISKDLGQHSLKVFHRSGNTRISEKLPSLQNEELRPSVNQHKINTHVSEKVATIPEELGVHDASMCSKKTVGKGKADHITHCTSKPMRKVICKVDELKVNKDKVKLTKKQSGVEVSCGPIQQDNGNRTGISSSSRKRVNNPRGEILKPGLENELTTTYRAAGRKQTKKNDKQNPSTVSEIIQASPGRKKTVKTKRKGKAFNGKSPVSHQKIQPVECKRISKTQSNTTTPNLKSRTNRRSMKESPRPKLKTKSLCTTPRSAKNKKKINYQKTDSESDVSENEQQPRKRVKLSRKAPSSKEAVNLGSPRKNSKLSEPDAKMKCRRIIVTPGMYSEFSSDDVSGPEDNSNRCLRSVNSVVSDNSLSQEEYQSADQHSSSQSEGLSDIQDGDSPVHDDVLLL